MLLTSAYQLEGRLKQVGKAVASSQDAAVKALGQEAKRIHDVAGARYHIKGRGKPGTPGRPVRLTTSAKPLGAGQVKVAPVPAGFWVIVEQGARPHVINPTFVKAKGRGAKRKNSIARFLRESGQSEGLLRIGERWVTGGVHHPGAPSQGKPWAEAKALVSHVAPTILIQRQTKAIIDAVR